MRHPAPLAALFPLLAAAAAACGSADTGDLFAEGEVYDCAVHVEPWPAHPGAVVAQLYLPPGARLLAVSASLSGPPAIPGSRGLALARDRGGRRVLIATLAASSPTLDALRVEPAGGVEVEEGDAFSAVAIPPLGAAVGVWRCEAR